MPSRRLRGRTAPPRRIPTIPTLKVFIVKSFVIGLFVAAGLVTGGALAQPAPNTLGKIKAAKAINVAFSGDSLPFSFVGPNNEPAGYSIDICKRVIAQIGRAVGEPNLKVNWMVGSVAERLQMVASGKADIECAQHDADAGAARQRRLLQPHLRRRRRISRQGGFADQQAGRHGRQEDRRAQAARRPRRG